jgi:hypothetical protein
MPIVVALPMREGTGGTQHTAECVYGSHHRQHDQQDERKQPIRPGVADVRIMASFYEPDASYGWSYSPTDHFMANGRDEIRDLALGTEMLGFQGWIYPYQGVIFYDRSGQALGLWRQLTTFHSPSGEPYEIKGLGGSWFQYSGNRSWSCQRDIFDVAMATDAMVRILRDDNSSPQLDETMRAIKSGNQPGHYDSWESMSAPLWPIPPVMQ